MPCMRPWRVRRKRGSAPFSTRLGRHLLDASTIRNPVSEQQVVDDMMRSAFLIEVEGLRFLTCRHSKSGKLLGLSLLRARSDG